RADLVQSFLRDARIPPRYARQDLSTFEPDTDSRREAIRLAKRFIEEFPVVDRGLLLHGRPGVGKTHLAIGILKEVIRSKGARGYFYGTTELLQLVRDTYNRSVQATEMGVLNPVLKAELLVLDDLKVERDSEWVLETLGLVVNTRYNAKLPTIFTSNLDDSADSEQPNTFIFQLGARTRSRLREMCRWVPISGPDVRDVGPNPSAEAIERWQKNSPASDENIKRNIAERPKSKMARARLKDPAAAELKWPGGRAGSLK
ncbi:MAG: ATP-binding protein, partial [Bryobacteraceae bacterium]